MSYKQIWAAYLLETCHLERERERYLSNGIGINKVLYMKWRSDCEDKWNMQLMLRPCLVFSGGEMRDVRC